MIEGIIVDNLFDLLLGLIVGWLLIGGKWQNVGIVIGVLYAIAIAGEYMQIGYFSIEWVAHVGAFLLGTFAAYVLRKTIKIIIKK